MKSRSIPLVAGKSGDLKFPGVYMIANLANGSIYIGANKSTKGTLQARRSNHANMLNYVRNETNPWLQIDWDIYGPDAFRFIPLEVVEDSDMLKWREAFWYGHLKFPKLYSKSWPGGTGPTPLLQGLHISREYLSYYTPPGEPPRIRPWSRRF